MCACVRRWSWRSTARRWSQAVTNGLSRPASNPYGDGSWVKCKDDGALPFDVEKAKALIKDYGKPVEFKTLVTATPRGRANGQVLQQFWKNVGANMEIEQVDQATIPPRAFMRQFQMTPWRIVDLADPDPQMYANFKTGSPVALANYSNPELDGLLDKARTTADTDKRIDLYCADHPADQQGGDLVLDLPEHLLRDLDGEDQRPAQDVQRGDRRIARLEGIASHGVLCRAPAALSGAGADCGLAADVLHRVTAAGRSCLSRSSATRRRRRISRRCGVTWDWICRSGSAISAGSAICCRAISAAPSAPARRCCRRSPSGCRYRSS